MLAMLRQAISSTTPASAISSADPTASPVSLCGDVLVDIRGSWLTISA